MEKYQFLAPIIDHDLVPPIIDALQERPMRFDDLAEYVVAEKPEYKERTVRARVQDLQGYHILTFDRDSDGQTHIYRLNDYQLWMERFYKPLRRSMKRQVFDEASY